MAYHDPPLKLGRIAEELALEYLQKQDLTLLEKNFRSPLGEIDLIMRDKNTIVFLEVRSRKNKRFLDPVETIDCRKKNKIIKTSQIFMQKLSSSRHFDFRFDVITLTGRNNERKIEWVKDAFQAE